MVEILRVVAVVLSGVIVVLLVSLFLAAIFNLLFAKDD